MKRTECPSRLSLLFAIIAFGTLPAVSARAGYDGPEQTGGISITEAGRDASGQKIFDLKAEGADVIDLLKRLFSRAGVNNYEISPEIRQSVTLSMKGATANEMINKVGASTSPPLTIQATGRNVVVTRSPNAFSRAEEIRRRMEAIQAGRNGIGIVPSGLSDAFGGTYRDAAALETPVTLVVPDDRPITLAAALQLMEKQTHVPIRLDPSLPSDIKFTGSVNRVPLRAVLQNIAPGGSEGTLKLIASTNQILIAPADRINVFWGGAAISSMQPCTRCRQPLLATWSFCPNCGQPTKRGLLQGNQGPGSNARRAGPGRPE